MPATRILLSDADPVVVEGLAEVLEAVQALRITRNVERLDQEDARRKIMVDRKKFVQCFSTLIDVKKCVGLVDQGNDTLVAKIRVGFFA